MGKARVRPSDDVFFTATMAELLEKQGQMEDALMIYKILSDSDPGNMLLSERVDRLKALAGRRSGERRKNGIS
ncbi:MAG: hypothetical protein V3W31_05565 [Thermodesulfobacteriota bacterium]